MLAPEILRTASELVTGDRHKDYGPLCDSFQTIRSLWNAYLNDYGVSLTAHDIAVLLALLKIARSMTGEPKADNYIDAAAYMAIAGELELVHSRNDDKAPKHEPSAPGENSWRG